MKITDQLVTILNVGLQDLFFEVGLLSRLDDFDTQVELEDYLKETFVRTLVDEQDKLTGAIKKVEKISEEEQNHISLKTSLESVKVSSKEELLVMMNKRYKTDLKSSQDGERFARSVRNDVADLVQIDRVLEGLNRLGLSSKSNKEIEKLRDKELIRVCELLLVKVEK